MQQNSKSYEVVDCHIELMYSQPVISRQVRVPTQIGLHHLHDIIQCVFSWTESHLHAFYIGDKEYQNPDQIFDFEDEFGPKPKNEKRMKLNSLLEDGVDNFRYVYDFGDNWEHSVRFKRDIPSMIQKKC